MERERAPEHRPAEPAGHAGSEATEPADAASYCPAPAVPAGRVPGPPYADCVECGEPTEYGVATAGVVLCPVCEWQDAQRSACSG
ncbi:hypothetical protein [Streptomyces sp. NPDC048606]|uniref:hypothetical protein n=1 Tax=Streptomyces sp. NPDC048606 TaxID=3154726 RepID=UPI00343CEB35